MLNPYKAFVDGDRGFAGVNLRLPVSELPSGIAADAENARFRYGVAETRKGVVKLPWLNQSDMSTPLMVLPFGTVYGAGVFRDPNSTEWVMICADGLVYRTRENNTPLTVALPTSVRVLSRTKVVQAFDKVYLFRGRDFAPLVLADLDTGFTDIVEHWDATATYAANDEVAFGPMLTISSLTSAGTTATAVTAAAHGFVPGTDVTIFNATQSEYNGRYPITVIDDVTFSYPFAGSGTATAASASTLKCSNMRTYYKALGSVLTLGAGELTSSSTTATVHHVAHGFTTGQTVTVSGAAQAPYNGTYVITVTDADHFTYTFAGSGTSPATGTIVLLNGAVVAGQNPDTNPEAWSRVYNILPNADDALYVQNRLLVPTAYAPGGASYGVGSDYTKKDYLVATDVLDEVHFDFVDDFRINQGSDDEIVEIQKFGDDKTVLVFKGKSWGVLGGVALDLSQIALDMRNTGWGQLTFDCSVVAGQDAFVLVPKRGVVSIRQTETNAVQSVDLPLSDEIQPLIERINWTLAATKARMAYWDNKLYVAVPLDDGVSKQYLQSPGAQFNEFGIVLAGTMGMEIGGTYYVEPGNVALFDFVTQGNALTSGSFVEAGTGGEPSGMIWNGTAGEYATGRLYQPLSGVNNALLVYDFLTKRWNGKDTGSALTVKEFFKATRRGVERLFFVAEDGYINLVEESDAGDQVADSDTDSGLRFDDISFRLRTRAYPTGNQRPTRALEGLATLGTWNPAWTAQVLYDGASESSYVDRDGVRTFERDRTKYIRPFDAADYDATNANNDFVTPYRQDYSVPLTSSGLTLGDGIQADLYQEAPWTFAISPHLGRYAQIELCNVRGRMQVKAVELTAVKAPRRKGMAI